MARQNGTEAANGSGGASAGRSEPNAKFKQTSFLYGGNAAYVEQLQADFERDPNSVDPEWRAFFAQLADDRGAIERNASGPQWRKPNWPVAANGELISALDGDWAKTPMRAGPPSGLTAARAPRRNSPRSPPTARRPRTCSARRAIRCAR